MQGSGSVFAIGKNPETEALARVIPLRGIVDDFAAPSSRWREIPCLRSAELPDRAWVVNCASSISPRSAEERILSNNHTLRLIRYHELTREDEIAFPEPAFVRETRESIAENPDAWEKVEGALADPESKSQFRRIRQFRTTGDPQWMKGLPARGEVQYFETTLLPSRLTSFVDGGGFDGDTTEQFAKRFPGFGEIWFFEPSHPNLAKARERLDGLGNVHFLPLGLSNREEKLRFDPAAGSASAVGADGTETIQATTLDRAVSGNISYLKLDIEGMEAKALNGAAGHLSRSRPILAVAGYHRGSDLVDLPRLVRSLAEGYRIYFRHYTEGWSESIFYFLPEKR